LKPPQALRGGGMATLKNPKPFFFFFLGLLGVANHPILAKGWLGPQQLLFLFLFFNFLFFFLFLFLKIDAQNGIVLG
jgi:hypothetical protein